MRALQLVFFLALTVVKQEARASTVSSTLAGRAAYGARTHHFLSVWAQFKDEDAILVDWVEHYLQQGVDHFFLLDDGSTDHSHAALRPYVREGLVTVMVDIRKNHLPPLTMVERYNLLFKPHLHTSTWILHVDCDEFVYGRKGIMTDFLRNADPLAGEIRIPWKLFGSSGHVSRPQGHFLRNFVHRANFTLVPSMTLHTKPLFRSAALVSEEVHYVHLKAGFYSGFALRDGTVRPEIYEWPSNPLAHSAWTALTSEEILDDLELHLNHYTTRWKDWFMAVKTTRGIADRDESIYDENYFNAYDTNDVVDDELARLSTL